MKRAKTVEREGYHASTGTVTKSHFLEALNEYERTGHRVLVAEKVRLQKWLKGSLNNSFPSIYVQAFYDGDHNTKGTLWIVKVASVAHGSLVALLNSLLGSYDTANGNCLQIRGGDLVLPGQVRRPDTAVVPFNSLLEGQSRLPRVVFEVVFLKDAGALQADNFCREYFGLIPVLQAAVFILVTKKNEDGTFGAVAVLYTRGEDGEVNVADAVSFGSVDISVSASTLLPEHISRALRHLTPLAPATILKDTACEWPSEERFFKVPGKAMFHKGPNSELISKAPISTAPCRIDLWMILYAISDDEW